MNVEDGLIAQYSKEAVNGSQLYRLQQMVNQNILDIAKNTVNTNINQRTIDKIVTALAAHKISIELDSDGAASVAAPPMPDASTDSFDYATDLVSNKELKKEAASNDYDSVSFSSSTFMNQVSALTFRLEESEVRISSLEQMVHELSEVLTK